MEQRKKAGLLERLYIACLRPSRYKELLSAEKGQHVAYVCFVLVLLVTIEAVIPFAAWDLSVGGFRGLITKRIPSFCVENGRMTIEEPVDFDMNGIVHFKADSGVEVFKKEDLDDKYQEELLFSATNLLIRMADRIKEVSMKEITDTRIDNKALADAVPLFRMMMGVYFISTYLVKAVEYLFAALFFAILCRAAIRTPDGKYVNLKGTLVIALYARTLFSLLHSVHFCLGSPLGETVILIAGTVGTILFIDRAEAAVLGVSLRNRFR